MPPTMKAAALVAPQRFAVRDVPVPEIGPQDVLIRIACCGICGTDVHIFNGHYAADRLPLVPGHEFSGTIAATGSAVTHLTAGQTVVADINIGCGHCYYCRRNEVLNCAEAAQIGITRDGGFAEYVAVPAERVIVAPQGADFATLSLVEPVACVVRAMRKSGLTFAQSVVVIGAGPIGNLHIQMARLIGAAPIIAIEPSEARADLARKAGADVVVSDPARARDTVLEWTDGRGADMAIESVGHVLLYQQALGLIRPGGHLAAFGITGPNDTIALPLLDTVLDETSIKGSVAGMGSDMHEAMTLLVHGRFRLQQFLGAEFGIEVIQQAFEGLSARPEILKTRIVF